VDGLRDVAGLPLRRAAHVQDAAGAALAQPRVELLDADLFGGGQRPARAVPLEDSAGEIAGHVLDADASEPRPRLANLIRFLGDSDWIRLTTQAVIFAVAALGLNLLGADGSEKEHYRIWVDGSGLGSGEKRLSYRLEDVPYQEGDRFVASVRTPVPAAERSLYKEFPVSQ